MRWLLAGLTFALTVALAIGTAAIRAENIRLRRWLDRDLLSIEDRAVELRRLSVRAMAAATPERLAEQLHRLLPPDRAPATLPGSRAGRPGLGIGPLRDPEGDSSWQ